MELNNGLDPKMVLMENLLSTIRINNEITNKQNSVLSQSTKWLVRLTVAIVVLTATMVVLMVLQYGYKQPSFIELPKQQTAASVSPSHNKVDNNTKGTKKNAVKQTKP